MKTVIDDIKKSDSGVAPILKRPETGLADALFSIALLLQQDGSNADLSILFASLSAYCAPEYPLPRLLTADILENANCMPRPIRLTHKFRPTATPITPPCSKPGKT